MKKLSAIFLVLAIFVLAAQAGAQTSMSTNTNVSVIGDKSYSESPNAYVAPSQFNIPPPTSQFLNTVTGENIWDISEMVNFKRVFTRFEFLNMLGFDPCADSTRKLKGARSKGRPFTGRMLKPEEQKLTDSVLVVFSMPVQGTASLLGSVDAVAKTAKVDSNETFAQMGIHALNMGADVLYIKSNGFYQRLVAEYLGLMLVGSGTGVSPSSGGHGGGGIGYSCSKMGIESYPVSTGYAFKSLPGVELQFVSRQVAPQQDPEQALKESDEERKELLKANGGRKAKAAAARK